MKKSTFPFNKITDEWNPHIVRHARDTAPKMENSIYAILAKVLDEQMQQHNLAEGKSSNDNDFVKKIIDGAQGGKYSVLDANFAKFIETFNNAQKVLNEVKPLGIYPLAYRLETVLSKPLKEDPIIGSKFGGVPDFRHMYNRLQGMVNSTPLKKIEYLWPKCGACGDHMNFLGDVDMSDWIVAIHHMTADNPTKTSYGTKLKKSDFKFYQSSAFGRSSDSAIDFWPSTRAVYQIFYCNDSHFDTPAFDAIIKLEHRHKDDDSQLMTKEAYQQIITDFVKANKIKSTVPIQTLDGLTLKFDLDVPGKEPSQDLMNKFYDAIAKHPELFGNHSSYQFFGRPQSQQEEARYACQNAYNGLHRMSPIINWTDADQDVTNQIYGCIKCKGFESNKVQCKIDKSCT